MESTHSVQMLLGIATCEDAPFAFLSFLVLRKRGDKTGHPIAMRSAAAPADD